MNENQILSNTVFDGVAVAASGTAYSPSIELGAFGVDGFFSLHVTSTSGSGTAKIEYELSGDGSTWVTPTTASDIVTAHTATSGPGSDGNDLYGFSPELAKWLRLKVTETGGANSVTITAELNIQ